MSDKDEARAAGLAALRSGKAGEYKVVRNRDGSIEVSADGAEDHRYAMEALERLGPVELPPQAEPAHAAASLPPGKTFEGPPPRVRPISMKGAADAWLVTMASKFSRPNQRKTYDKHRRTIEAFMAQVKPRTLVYTVGRPECAQFAQQKFKTLALTTVNLEMTWLTAFFAWAMSSGYYPVGDNPATGHANVPESEKEFAADVRGWQPYRRVELQRIFDPTNFALLPTVRDRWFPVLGLYTGGRSNEFARLELDDVCIDEDSGVAVIDVNRVGENKGIKSKASKRKIPIHEDLLALGLMERVRALQEAGETYLFPDLSQIVQNGPAAAPQRAFLRYLDRLKISPRTGKYGLHAFRDTVITTMEDARVSQGWRERYTGHKESEQLSTVKTSHARAYGGNALRALADECHTALNWGAAGIISIPAIRALLTEAQ